MCSELLALNHISCGLQCLPWAMYHVICIVYSGPCVMCYPLSAMYHMTCKEHCRNNGLKIKIEHET
jgi:hypothetical protein